MPSVVFFFRDAQKYLRRRCGIFLLILAALFQAGGESLFGLTGPVTFTIQQTNPGDPVTDFHLQAQASMPPGTAWTLERSLNTGVPGGSAGGWFPMSTGYGSFIAPRDGLPLPPSGVPFLSVPLNLPTGRDGFTARLLTLPLVPQPPAPNAIGQVRLTPYHLANVWLRRWSGTPGKGTVVAQWKSAAPPGAIVTAVFTPSELDIGQPGDGDRFPFGVGCLTGPRTDAWPIFLSFFAYDLQDAPSTFTSSTGLSMEDAAIRQFLKDHKLEIQAALWPPESTEPPSPPSPATLDQRSFFRLRTSAPPALTNGVPTAIAAESNAPAPGNRTLRISEVCCSRTSVSSSDLVGGEAADWVEIWNASSTPISTSRYYLTDDNTAGNRKKFALPPGRTIPPGGYLIIHCTAAGKARLVYPDPLIEVTAPFDLKAGDRVYLNYESGSGAGSVISTFSQMPPAGITVSPGSLPARCFLDVSYGIQQNSAGAITYGWFANPTPGLLNADAMLTAGTVGSAMPAVCAEPQVEDSASSLTAPVLVKGQLFSTGGFSIRLRPGSAADTVLYTLNGTEPTGQSGVYDPARPIQISGTAILRTRSVRAGALPSATITRSFIHLPTVPTQFRPGTVNTPLCDPGIAGRYALAAGDLEGYPAAGGIAAQLQARPVLALTFSGGQIDAAGAESSDGSAVSVEFIDPASPAAYSQENSWLRPAGNHNGSSPSIKNSWHLLFKKNRTLQGGDRWQTPSVSGGGVTRSVLFPSSTTASSVTSFSRLVLRGGGSDAWGDVLNGRPFNKTLLRDAWLKETQRALGDWTARRRSVSVFLNGLYWGMYDLEEHLDSDTLSDWLSSAPGLSQAQKDALAAKNILFLKYLDTPDRPAGLSNTDLAPNDPLAHASWMSVIAAAEAARQNPSSSALWDSFNNLIDIDNYTGYMITLALCGKEDRGAWQYASWRHPVDQKWRLLQWDGDALAFMNYNVVTRQVYSGPDVLVPEDLHDDYAARLQSSPNSLLMDQVPHEYLKFHPRYRAAFERRLRELYLPAPATGTVPRGAGALIQGNILNRFDTLAGQVRLTLEAEIMRWAPSDPNYGGGEDSSIRNIWAALIHRTRFLDNTSLGDPLCPVQLTRFNTKTAARWAGLLNDIPPPTITWTPATLTTVATATATRSGSIGRVYITSHDLYQDVREEIKNPEYRKSDSLSASWTPAPGHKFISARVYSSDFENQAGWSAETIFVIP